MTRLRTAGIPIGAVVVYTASTDPNHLLGRPNGYLAKNAWVDSRVNRADATDDSPGSVDLGGSIEEYSDAAGATRRMTYIQTAERDNPIVGTEYDYVVGRCLIRISSVLTPAQAVAYRSAASH